MNPRLVWPGRSAAHRGHRRVLSNARRRVRSEESQFDPIRPPCPGEKFRADNLSRWPASVDFDEPAEPTGITWARLTTTPRPRSCGFWQGSSPQAAPTTPRFARPFNARAGLLCRAIPERRLAAGLAAQGGYHDGITYNDDAMLNVLELLRDVAAGTNKFAFVPAKRPSGREFETRPRCVLATQVIVGGHRTAWCQQYDALSCSRRPRATTRCRPWPAARARA